MLLLGSAECGAYVRHTSALVNQLLAGLGPVTCDVCDV